MVATSIQTIRQAIIALLRRSGHSPIEATNKWDKVYKRTIEHATPNVTHKLIIGKYTFEYTKKGGS